MVFSLGGMGGRRPSGPVRLDLTTFFPGIVGRSSIDGAAVPSLNVAKPAKTAVEQPATA
jgi:hypothetical protein